MFSARRVFNDSNDALGGRRVSQRQPWDNGFTLVEIMVAVAILAFGLVPIFGALFISLDTFSLYSNSLNAQIWIDERIWEIKDELMRSETLHTGGTVGRMQGSPKDLDWKMSIDLIDAEIGLYRLHLTLFWQEGERRTEVPRVAYALAPFKEEKDKETVSK